jgi:hypothetical protein
VKSPKFVALALILVTHADSRGTSPAKSLISTQHSAAEPFHRQGHTPPITHPLNNYSLPSTTKSLNLSILPLHNFT